MTFPWQKLTRSSQLVWLAMLLSYALVQWGRGAGQVPQLVDWYLADFLCLPLVLGLVLVVQRLAGQSLAWTLPWWHGLAGALAYGIYFEAILPSFSASAVADPRDAVGYLLGWLVFELLINRPAPQ